jgi:hypothetical protein
MNGQVPDPDAPDLGIGMTREEALGGGQGVIRDLEGTGVHVDGPDLAVITGLQLR